jgi:hypothetical protein
LRHEKSADKDETMTEIPGNQPPPPLSPDPAQPIAPPATPPPVQSYAQPVAAYVPYPATGYAAPKQGPSALKIVVIVVGIFVGLGLIGVGFLSYGIYKVMKSSNITASTRQVTEADLGVPIYPGAEQGKASVRMTVAGKDMLTATFLAPDSKEQVVAFYKSSLGPEAEATTSFNGQSFTLDKGAGELVVVSVSEQPGGIGGKTQIVIMHSTKAAAQSK